jgi:hypothetical protein
MKKALVAIAALCLIYVGAVLWFRDPDMGLHYHRDDLRRDSLRFGMDFLWGSSTSAYQVEGNCTNNNWYLFESAADEQGRPRIARGQWCRRSRPVFGSMQRRASIFRGEVLAVDFSDCLDLTVEA